MKKLLCSLLAVLMVLSLAGCGKGSPKQAANDFMSAIKKNDEKLLDKIYIGEAGENSVLGELIQIIDETESLGEIGKTLKKYMLEFKYKVVEVEQDGDEAEARIQITTENWAKVLPDLAILIPAKMISMSLDGKSEKAIQKELKKLVDEKRKNTDDVDFYVDLPLILDDGKWKVDLSEQADALLHAITGGWY